MSSQAADPFFFGYGSLVNRLTHPYHRAYRARVSGWRRVWRHTALRPVAFLTVVPDPAGCIDGLIAAVPGGDWVTLDRRERAYDRVTVSTAVQHDLDPATEIAIYTIPEDRHEAPSMAHPILLSYLDCVFQGYLREFGEAGLHRFIDSTDGWDAPLIDDRAHPRYPRHQVLTRAEQTLFDSLLADLPLHLLKTG